MTFNEHSELKDLHSFLSPSNYHWLRYDAEKLIRVYRNRKEAARGTELHELAAKLIRMGIKLPRSSKTLNLFVNDAISWRMFPERTLYYSPRCFGTTDAIVRKGDVLRIHDLKTGVEPGNMNQLEIYAALYCLEYGVDPHKLTIILRIYQHDDIVEIVADPVWIAEIMQIIITFDKLLQEEEG